MSITSDATDRAAITALIHRTGISRCRTTISMTVTTPNITGIARVPRSAVNVAESAPIGACRPRAHSSSARHLPTWTGVWTVIEQHQRGSVRWSAAVRWLR
ncbi:hypothetical protein AYK61_02235 [Rhodococcus sp. SBT000017]|nr:hypothetical protein AYK61_02235 [Rhodococcus sp. SBT000017]